MVIIQFYDIFIAQFGQWLETQLFSFPDNKSDQNKTGRPSKEFLQVTNERKVSILSLVNTPVLYYNIYVLRKTNL